MHFTVEFSTGQISPFQLSQLSQLSKKWQKQPNLQRNLLSFTFSQSILDRSCSHCENLAAIEPRLTVLDLDLYHLTISRLVQDNLQSIHLKIKLILQIQPLIDWKLAIEFRNSGFRKDENHVPSLELHNGKSREIVKIRVSGWKVY